MVKRYSMLQLLVNLFQQILNKVRLDQRGQLAQHQLYLDQRGQLENKETQGQLGQ
jgi:hypothetical protein